MMPLVVDNKIVTNDYGQPEFEYVDSSAHIRYDILNLFDEKGEGYTSDAQIYIPFNSKTVSINDKVQIRITLPNKQVNIYRIKKIEYGQNVIGKVEFIKVLL